MKRIRTIAICAAMAVSVLAAGCSNGTASPAPSSADSKNAAAKYGVPSGIDKITIGTSIASAPFEYYDTDGKTILGFEAELLEEIGKLLGVRVEMKAAEFASLFAGLDSGRYDALMNGILDRKSRQEKYDLVDYMKDESVVIGLTGSTSSIRSLTDFCGHSVVVQQGSTYETFFNDLKNECKQEGRSEITMVQVADVNAQNLAVRTGRAEYAAGQLSGLGYRVKQLKGFELSEFTFLPTLLAIVFERDSELIPPIRAALDELMANGTYEKIFDKWELSRVTIPKTLLNAGTAE